MPELWRRLGPEALSGPAAVARPQGLLDAMSPGRPPVASWSTVTDPVLVLGRAARDPVINPAGLAAAGVELVRRRSGGGPVLWDAGLLSLDVVLPPGHRLAARDLALAYRWIGEALAEAIATLDVDCRAVSVAEARTAQARDDETARRAARACFGGLSPFEVVARDGRKVVGLSQVRRRTGSLFQCGIALDLDAEGLARLLEPDHLEAAALAAALGTVATGLRQIRGGLSPGDVVAAVEGALERREGVRLAPHGLSGEPVAR